VDSDYVFVGYGGGRHFRDNFGTAICLNIPSILKAVFNHERGKTVDLEHLCLFYDHNKTPIRQSDLSYFSWATGCEPAPNYDHKARFGINARHAAQIVGLHPTFKAWKRKKECQQQASV